MKGYLTALCLLGCIGALAQEKELDPVTITSSMQAKPASRTGRNIISVSGAQFSKLPVQSLDEFIRYIPGVEVQMRGPMGAQSDITVRGGTFQQVLILLDGVRLNDPNTGHFNNLIPIVPAEIERVELLKGASSAIYGSEAVGGVIHIITKAFAARGKQPGLHAQAQLTAGEYGLWQLGAGAVYQTAKTTIAGGLLSNNTDGQAQRGTKGFVNANTASLSVTHLFNDRWQMSVRAAYDNRDFAAQNFYTVFASDTAQEEVRTIWTQARLAYTHGRHRVSLDAGYKNVEDEYLYNSRSVANNSVSKMWQATVMDEYKVSESTFITTGAQFINKSIQSNDRGNHSVPQAAVFAVLNQSIGERWMFNPALRLDWNERSGTELVPQLNISYRAKELQLRGSAGKTIRDADFTERFNNYNKTNLASGRVGNPDLVAERSLSYELGADYFGIRHLRVSATLFRREQRKLIDYILTPYAEMPRQENLVPGGTYAFGKNIARVNTSGAELDLQYSRELADDKRLSLGAGLLWVNSRSADTVPSFYVASHARFLFNFSGDLELGRLTISANGIYKHRDGQLAPAISAKLSQDYFVINARAGYQVVNNRLGVFLQATNLTDVHYSDLLGSQMPGRWWMGGLNFVLGK